MIREILKRPEANVVLSVAIGVGIAVLLCHRARKEFIVPAIDLDQITQSISKIDGKCYRFRIVDASEPPM
jgi:hypothetical protein